MRNLVTEFIGTFFLVLTVCLTVTGEVPMAPLAIGCSLMVMVYMGGHISGGHYNPAVSLALLLRGKMPGKDFIPYVVAQVLGAIVAAYLSSVIFGRTIPIAPSANASVVAALLVEILFTFALALVVLNVATHPDVKGNSFYGLAIGFTIVVAAFAGGGISGGAFNPAVGTGITVVHALLGGGSFASWWLYLVGPFAGGALAAVVYKIQEGAAA
ncbi:MAG TPA: MIP/aquaporin family protein [Gemmatimonadales bacterium]|nr:MIP/aquaporin family protein [Gemmatimonadales bacterium]